MDRNISTDSDLARIIGVSVTQVWRAKLPPSDKRHNTPGVHFIAGVMTAFNAPFEKFFYLDEAN